MKLIVIGKSQFMYVRFVINEKDEDSQKRLGILHAIRYLRDDGKLSSYEEEYMNEVVKWFADNLKKPNRFSKAKRKNPVAKAISWFKDSATEDIFKMREITAVLRSHGIQVDIIKTDRPGYIVYEDEFQVTAEPFNETET